MKRMSSLCSVIVFGLGISSTFGCGSASDPPTSAGDVNGSISARDSEASGDQASAQDAAVSTNAFSRLSGSVTDIGTGSPKLGLAGAGTLASASAVRVVEIGAGELSVLAHGALDATGAYSVEVPPNKSLVIAQAVNAAGEVLGSVIVGATASEASELVVAAPIGTESSLEAQVLLELSSCQHDCAASSFADLVALIDAKLAAALSALASTTGSIEHQEIIRAFAKATVAAERAQAAAFADAGVQLDTTELAEGKLEALATLNAALASGASLDAATAELLAGLDSAVKAAGAVSAQVRAAAQAAASATFRASLSASLGTEASAVLFAAIHAAAELEARATAAALEELVILSDAEQAVIDATAEACAQLLVDVEVATSLDALSSAKADFIAAISASISANASGIVSGVLTTATGTAHASMDAMLAASAELRAELEAELDKATSALRGAELCVAADASDSTAAAAAAAEVTATTDLVIAAYAKFTAGMQSLAPGLTGLTPAQAKLVTDAVAMAEAMLCMP